MPPTSRSSRSPLVVRRSGRLQVRRGTVGPMSRVMTVVLTSALVAAAVLRSHLLPLCLLALLGALAGLLAATQMKESRDLVRVPVMVAVTALALVGVGQMGAVGILLGVVLLIA